MNIVIWPWLILGTVPYCIKWKKIERGWTLRARALAWLIELHFQRGNESSWTFCSPLIERLGKALWTTIVHYQKNELPQEEEQSPGMMLLGSLRE